MGDHFFQKKKKDLWEIINEGLLLMMMMMDPRDI